MTLRNVRWLPYNKSYSPSQYQPTTTYQIHCILLPSQTSAEKQSSKHAKYRRAMLSKSTAKPNNTWLRKTSPMGSTPQNVINNKNYTYNQGLQPNRSLLAPYYRHSSLMKQKSDANSDTLPTTQSLGQTTADQPSWKLSHTHHTIWPHLIIR